MYTTIGAGKFIELLIEDVTSVLLNIGSLINSIPLLENWTWFMLSGRFLVTLDASGLYILDLMLSGVAIYYLRQVRW